MRTRLGERVGGGDQLPLCQARLVLDVRVVEARQNLPSAPSSLLDEHLDDLGVILEEP